MNRIKYSIRSLCAVAAMLCVIQASAGSNSGSKSGLIAINPPGSWVESWEPNHPYAAGNQIRFESEGVYSFTAVLSFPRWLVDDPHGWQFETTYEHGTLTLQNRAGTPWYNPNDGRSEWTYTEIIAVRLSTDVSYLNETELSFYFEGPRGSARPIIICSYSGPVNYIYGTDTKGNPACVGASGELDAAAIRVPTTK